MAEGNIGNNMQHETTAKTTVTAQTYIETNSGICI